MQCTVTLVSAVSPGGSKPEVPLPSFRAVLSLTITGYFCAAPRTSIAIVASVRDSLVSNAVYGDSRNQPNPLQPIWPISDGEFVTMHAGGFSRSQKLSVGALTQQLPFLLIKENICQSFKVFWNSPQEYSLPRSPWPGPLGRQGPGR